MYTGFVFHFPCKTCCSQCHENPSICTFLCDWSYTRTPELEVVFCIGSVISCTSCWGLKGQRLLLFIVHVKIQHTEIFLIYVLLYIRAMKLGLSVVTDNLQDSFKAEEENFLCPQQHHCCLVDSDWHFEHEKAKLQIKGFECLYSSGESLVSQEGASSRVVD